MQQALAGAAGGPGGLGTGLSLQEVVYGGTPELLSPLSSSSAVESVRDGVSQYVPGGYPIWSDSDTSDDEQVVMSRSRNEQEAVMRSEFGLSIIDTVTLLE